eukprot:4501083-Prymnesium_polylepis.1
MTPSLIQPCLERAASATSSLKCAKHTREDWVKITRARRGRGEGQGEASQASASPRCEDEDEGVRCEGEGKGGEDVTCAHAVAQLVGRELNS